MSRPNKHPAPTLCPVCSSPTFVERVRCEACGTAVEGRFSIDGLEGLSREQLAFVKVFISCRGKIKDVEQALGISYPTVVSRLDDVAEALASGSASTADRSSRRKQVLDDLAAGTIDAQEAARRLRHT